MLELQPTTARILVGYSVLAGVFPTIFGPIAQPEAVPCFLEVSVKLLTKFNLVLLVVFGLGMYLISHFAYNFLM